MKKGKVFGKRQLVLAGLVLCLGAAVWINMRFAQNGSADGTDLGSESFLAGSGNLGEAVQAGAEISSIEKSRSDLKETREKLLKTLGDTANKAGEDDTVKKGAVDQLAKLTDTMNREAATEAVVRSKGFDDALVIISDNSVTVMVTADSLLQSQTLQIQDAVVSQTGVELDKIKIITVK